ncbi:hypothetical protein D3C81_1669270 [compost metagenome]
MIPMGRFIQKIQCQDTCSRIQPERVGPIAGASIAEADQMPMATACFSRGIT